MVSTFTKFQATTEAMKNPKLLTTLITEKLLA